MTIRRSIYFTTALGIAALVVFLLVGGLTAQGQEDSQRTADELRERIQEIQKEINSLDGELEDVLAEKRSLENEIFRLNTEIRRTELAIEGLTLSIQNTNQSIKQREVKIDNTLASMQKQRSSLAEYVRILHKYSDRSLVEIMLSQDLSDFFKEVSILEGLQEDAQVTLDHLRKLKADLEAEQAALEDRREELVDLRGLQQLQKQNVATKKQQKNQILSQTKGEEARYQQLITQKQRDIAAIRNQLSYLERTGITAEDAVEYAELAASRTGIRPAFLLGLLEIETGRRFANGQITAGSNLGSGNWQDDMVKCYERLGDIYYPHRRAHYYNRARTEESAFLQITRELGLNPDSVAVSAEPTYGCGGAMGPAQFIPSTWLLFKDRVARLTGHNPPNPWDVEDAFTASALYLADAGATAQTRTGEMRAARAYIGGSPNCSSSTCVWYSNEVLRVAGLIDKAL